jgi:hypothetical protein
MLTPQQLYDIVKVDNIYFQTTAEESVSEVESLP